MSELKLTDLKARKFASSKSWNSGAKIEEIAFLCPRCRKHEIAVCFWEAEPSQSVQIGICEYGNLVGAPITRKVWQRTYGSFEGGDLSLSPSINREGLGDKCGGWHGFITNGKAR